LTSHVYKRWLQRIGYKSNVAIRSNINTIINNGTKYKISDNTYRICYQNICVVFMELSLLHALALTVYIKDEQELSAI
jgi:hypothetical protein